MTTATLQQERVERPVPIDRRLRARRAEVLRRRGRRRLRALLTVLLVSVIGVGAVAVSRSELLDVDRVAVTGAERTAADDVVAAAAITPGTPLLDVDLAAARARVASLPWVGEVRTERSWRGTVTVVVSERQPVAALATPTGWLVVDASGRVLEVADGESAPPLVLIDAPLVRGAAGAWLPEPFDAALAVAALLPAGLAPLVDQVRAEPLELDLRAGGVVRLGSADELDEKFLAALTVLTKVDVSCLTVLDVGVPTAPFLTRRADCP